MHELSLAQAILETVDRHRDGRAAARVTVRIGHLRQVVPDSLRFSWEVLTDQTDLSGCELCVDHVPAVIRCRICEGTATLDLPVLMCAACQTSDVELLSGRELQVVSIDVAEEVR